VINICIEEAKKQGLCFFQITDFVDTLLFHFTVEVTEVQPILQPPFLIFSTTIIV